MFTIIQDSKIKKESPLIYIYIYGNRIVNKTKKSSQDI